MKNNTTMLLNIDKPLRRATCHHLHCSFIPQPLETEYKLVNQLGRDGGWFEVNSIEEAQAIAKREFPQAKFAECQRCLS